MILYCVDFQIENIDDYLRIVKETGSKSSTVRNHHKSMKKYGIYQHFYILCSFNWHSYLESCIAVVYMVL